MKAIWLEDLSNVNEEVRPMCMDPPQNRSTPFPFSNKIPFIIATLLILILIPLVIGAEESITMMTSKTRDETYSHSIIQTQDGGYAFSGYVRHIKDEYSPLAGGNYLAGGMWLAKSDHNGILEWNRTLHDSTPEYLLETTDGDLLLIGRINHESSTSHESLSYNVHRFTNNGNLMWNKSLFPGGVSEGSYTVDNVYKTKDGGFICVGVLRYVTGGWGFQFPEGIWINKYSKDGMVEWNHTLEDKNYATAIITLDEEVLALVQGYGDVEIIRGIKDYGALKFNANGSIQWTQTYNFTFLSPLNDLFLTPDSGSLLVGPKDLIKLDPLGVMEWNYSVEDWNENLSDLLITPNGGFIIIKHLAEDLIANNLTETLGHPPFLIQLMKFDKTGSIQWNHNFSVNQEAPMNLFYTTGGTLLTGPEFLEYYAENGTKISHKAHNLSISTEYNSDSKFIQLAENKFLLRVSSNELICIDSNGSLLWKQNMVTDDWSGLGDYTKTVNGDIIFVGVSVINPANPSSPTLAYIVKINNNGVILWEHNYIFTFLPPSSKTTGFPNLVLLFSFGVLIITWRRRKYRPGNIVWR